MLALIRALCWAEAATAAIVPRKKIKKPAPERRRLEAVCSRGAWAARRSPDYFWMLA
jgi:hypothetical protein